TISPNWKRWKVTLAAGAVTTAAARFAAALCRVEASAVQLAGRIDLGRHPRRVLGDQRHMGPRDLLPRAARLVHRDRSLPRPERLATASPGPSGAGGVADHADPAQTDLLRRPRAHGGSVLPG